MPGECKRFPETGSKFRARECFTDFATHSLLLLLLVPVLQDAVPSSEPPQHQPCSKLVCLKLCKVSALVSHVWDLLSPPYPSANLPYTRTRTKARTPRSAHWGKTCFEKQSCITATKAGQKQAFRLQRRRLKIEKKRHLA